MGRFSAQDRKSRHNRFILQLVANFINDYNSDTGGMLLLKPECEGESLDKIVRQNFRVRVF